MEQKNPQTESATIDQLQKYAKDLAEVYQLKKEKVKELHTAKQQLFK
jgi:predicted methyltransferase